MLPTTSTLARPTPAEPLARSNLLSPRAALVRRAFLDARTRTAAFAYVFALYSWLQAAGYHSAYPTVADRMAFAHAFAGNDAIRLFYGYPYDVLTVGGYSAWRVGGTLAIAAAAFGVLGAVRALRAEEDAGRTELVLSGVVSRRTGFNCAMAAVLGAAGILWMAETIGFVVSGLPLIGSAYLALGTVSVMPVFTGIGALACQLASSRRIALGIGGAAVASFWLLRVLSDTFVGMAWLRWATPLGWAEALRPFASARPVVLLLPALATGVLLVVAAHLAVARDVGTGLVPTRNPAAPSVRLLSSVTAATLRLGRSILATWISAFAVFGVILGMISDSVSSAGLSQRIQDDLAKLGSGSVNTPGGYLSIVFVVFIFVVCLFVSSQLGAAREEEAIQRLETVLALPVGRYRWLGGRVALAAVGAAALSATAGIFTWFGAASQGVHISLSQMLEAGANCMPTALLFLGISAIAYAVVPRASAALSYGIVSAAFLWYMVGSLLGVPRWLVDLTPFEHIGLVPTQPFRLGAALIMVAIGAVGAGAALRLFRRRDLLAA